MRPLNVEDAKGTTHARDTLIHTYTQTETHTHTLIYMSMYEATLCWASIYDYNVYVRACVPSVMHMALWECVYYYNAWDEMRKLKGWERKHHPCGNISFLAQAISLKQYFSIL